MHEKYLYRVLKYTENINDGLKARDPTSTRTVCEHVESGSDYPSRFLSTSANREAAKLFASKGWHQPKRIAHIDCECLRRENPRVQFIDLRDSSVLQRYIGPDKPVVRRCAQKYAEVLIEGYVPPSCVRIELVQ
ncbi:uncharacterized protein LOC127839888 [Dreissena polymorpha]|uniref:Uncharacterized protein n=1 Tax=Dreissena polymorpha TaxID=45954 RepID=A0A9D4J9J6_DREPO|nr:uncharacterized protein LOC127839888 [Dreissena polymorpha]KAH3800463.1 hypothetical protein DPMN_154096 [Dreissena polymorpha]